MERFLSGEPVTACPPSPFYRFGKFAKRNRTALVTSGIVAVSLVLGAVGVAYQAVRASRAEARANIAAFEFLIENVLGSNNSQTSEGYTPDPNLKLLILLKNANDRVDEHFAGEPELRAKMKATLASLFNNAGQYEDAARLYREYLEYLKANKGPNDPDTIRVMHHLVRIHIDESRLIDAERLGKEALSSSQLYLGKEHEVTLLLLNDLAMLHHKLGANQKAIDSYRQVLEVRQRLLGESHPDTLATMSNLAGVYDSNDRFDEAQELHERVLESYKATLSPHDARLAAALHNLGKYYLMRGRRNESKEQFEKATTLLQNSLQIYVDNRGDDHTNTLESKFSLAQVHLELQRLDQAQPLLEDLVERLERSREPGDWMTLNAMNMLGWTYMHHTQFAEAEYLLTNAYEQLMQLDPNAQLTIQVMGNLAIVRFRMGKIDEAVSLDEKTLKLSKDVLGPDHPETLAAKARLGLAYQRLGDEVGARLFIEAPIE